MDERKYTSGEIESGLEAIGFSSENAQDTTDSLVKAMNKNILIGKYRLVKVFTPISGHSLWNVLDIEDKPVNRKPMRFAEATMYLSSLEKGCEKHD